MRERFRCYRVVLALAAILSSASSRSAGNADDLFRRACVAEVAGKADEAHGLWREFLAAEPEGKRADLVRYRMVVVETKELGKSVRHYPVWSPDGRRIMFGYGGLAIWDLATNQSVSAESPTGEMYNHDWSPDGITIASRQKGENGRPVITLHERQPDEALFPTGNGQPVCEGTMARFDWFGQRLMISAAAKEIGGRRVSLGIALFDMQEQKVCSIPWRHPVRPARNQASWAGDFAYVCHAYGPDMLDDRAIVVAPLELNPDLPPRQISDTGEDNRTPAVAVDGIRLAYSQRVQGKPELLFLATTDGSVAPVQLMPGREPYWSPDGKWLAIDSPVGVKLLHMGGLGPGFLHVTAAKKGNAISLTMTNDGDAPVECRITCQVYDDSSFRVAAWSWEETPQTVAPGQALSQEYPIPADILESAASARFRVCPADGCPVAAIAELKPAIR